MLRSTSLDELPEVFCILKGDMSVIGPRPQLVRDMVFMNETQRMRHTAKPGLTGLAQATVMKAYGKVVELEGEVKGPKVLGTFGASYLYPIFVKMGLIKTAGA